MATICCWLGDHLLHIFYLLETKTIFPPSLTVVSCNPLSHSLTSSDPGVSVSDCDSFLGVEFLEDSSLFSSKVTQPLPRTLWAASVSPMIVRINVAQSHLSQLTLITVCSSSGHCTLVSLPVSVCQVSAAPVWPVWPGCRIWNQISPARLVTLPGYHWLSQSRDTHCNQIFIITLALSTLDQCWKYCQLVLGYQL